MPKNNSTEAHFPAFRPYGRQPNIPARQGRAQKIPSTSKIDASVGFDAAALDSRIHQLLRRAFVFPFQIPIHFLGKSHAERLMGPFLVELFAPQIKGGLALGVSGALELTADIQMQSLMRSVVLRATGASSLQIDSQRQPPCRQS